MYIDDGPFLPSLEHLVEHFMRFADGLPVNLKYPVLPKPKPPLPLFSTMPRSTPRKSSDAIKVPQHQSVQNSIEKSPLHSPLKHTPTLSTTLSPNSNTKKKSKEHTSSVFSTLRIKSPKKSSILESMSTLRKNKLKQKSISCDARSNISANDEELKQAEALLKNISFSTDFAGLQSSTTNNNNSADEFYNVPRNNAAISGDVYSVGSKLDTSSSALELEAKTEEEVEYFTKSDVVIERERNNVSNEM